MPICRGLVGDRRRLDSRWTVQRVDAVLTHLRVGKGVETEHAATPNPSS